MWNGMLCTVEKAHVRKLDLRDPYGYLHEGVPKKEVDKLDPEEREAKLTIKRD